MGINLDLPAALRISTNVPLIIDKLIKEIPFDKNKGFYHHKSDINKQELEKRRSWESNIKSQAFDTCKDLFLNEELSMDIKQYIRDSINNYFNNASK